jgi:hypothetical protein
VLKEQLENAKENVCFSIRSITDDYRDATGQVFKIIKEIYTWDYVNEPGISAARKWLSPALESLGTEMAFEPKHLIAAANLARLVNNGMESNITAAVTRTMESLGWTTDNRFTKSELILPPSARW